MKGREALPDISWFSPDGTEMTEEDWDAGQTRSIQVFINGNQINVPDERGEIPHDDSFVLIFHAAPEDEQIKLPELKWGKTWRRVFDTARGFCGDEIESFEAGTTLTVLGRSMWLLQRENR